MVFQAARNYVHQQSACEGDVLCGARGWIFWMPPITIPSDDAETLTNVTDVWLPSNNSLHNLYQQHSARKKCNELRKGINCFSAIFAISDAQIVAPLSNSSANTMKGVESMYKTEVDTFACILCPLHTSSLPSWGLFWSFRQILRCTFPLRSLVQSKCP